MSQPSILRRLRIFQIRAAASLLTAIGERSSSRKLLINLRSRSWMQSVLGAALGYRRTFPSFSEAQACASKYVNAGHEHPDEIRYHTSIADTVRESDYPVLLHLAPLAPSLRSVFDFGGNVGNLFYAYQRTLNFSPDLFWTVYDLPVKKPLLEKLAAERAESRLRFSENFADASGSDAFIASGSLHYFEEPLDELLRTLDVLPAHVFVNRTPCSTGKALITVQDNRSYLVPCKLHSRDLLISRMQTIGYQLIAGWPVHERKLWVPTHPDLSARTYFGFYFRRDKA